MIYSIAGLNIKFENRSKYTDMVSEGYVAENQNVEPDLCAALTNEDMEKEMRLTPTFPPYMVENMAIFRKIAEQLYQFDRFVLHSTVLNFIVFSFCLALNPPVIIKGMNSNPWNKPNTAYVQLSPCQSPTRSIFTRIATIRPNFPHFLITKLSGVKT